MKRKFPFKKILILVAILALPGFLYYLLQAKGKNRYKPLPIYGPKAVLKTFHKKRGKIIPDTLYHQVGKISGIDQNNNLQILDTNKNQLLIVHFFYTRNSNLNKIINKNIAPISKEFQNNKLVKFVWISVDQKYDVPNILKNYANQNNFINNKNWIILSNTVKDVFSIAKSEFFINALQIENKEIVVSEKIILLDTNMRIRGFYDGTSVSATKQLSDEIKVQITEELRKIKAEL